MPDHSTVHVLVVDDNAANVALYERVIADVQGTIARCFTLPLQALEWSVEHRPLLVVLDYRMPEIDGLEFIRRFRMIPERNAVPIVMLTSASNDPELRRQALELGVAEFMTKPIDRRRLQAHILRSLQRRIAEKQG